MSQLGKLWRSHKAYLKKKCCKKGLKKKDVMGLHLVGVDFEKFHTLVDFWFSRKGNVFLFDMLNVKNYFIYWT